MQSLSAVFVCAVVLAGSVALALKLTRRKRLLSDAAVS